MKISELIRALYKLYQLRGDLSIFAQDDSNGHYWPIYDLACVNPAEDDELESIVSIVGNHQICMLKLGY